MGKVLSVDLAYKDIKNFGICLIEETGGKVTRVTFPKPSEIGLVNPPDAGQCAQATQDFCLKKRVQVLLLDGPQGWKAPQNGLQHSRVCEKRLNTPAKTGTKGHVKPKTWAPFVKFSIDIFQNLVNLGCTLLSSGTAVVPPGGGLLALESFPMSAWVKLGIPVLPAKNRARPENLDSRLRTLQDRYGFTVESEPNHDELQALVSGLAGVAILAGNAEGYLADGLPPSTQEGVTMEGFIVNPLCNGPRIMDTRSRLSPATTPQGSKPSAKPDVETLERMLYYLKLTRAAEDRIERVLYRQGKIVGGVYTGRGQEAIGVASAIQLIDGDVVLPSHRDFSSFVIRGFTLREIFLNWMGRASSPTRGHDNTLHIGDLKRGVIPIISHLGDTCPVACGVAMTLKWRGQGNVAVVHFGEGTTSRGDVHEAMNMASVMALPVIFICNNNGYAYSTPTKKQYAVENLSVRGAAYAMPGTTVDGNNVLAVYAAARQALARARAGEGPSFIECKTFRMTGHSAQDAAEYVPKEVLRKWAKKDPILQFEKTLKAKGLIKAQRVQELESNIQREIDEAVAFAESSPMPEGATATEGVYCGPKCWWDKD